MSSKSISRVTIMTKTLTRNRTKRRKKFTHRLGKVVRTPPWGNAKIAAVMKAVLILRAIARRIKSIITNT